VRSTCDSGENGSVAQHEPMIPLLTRLKFAFKAFFSLLLHGRVPDDLAETTNGATRSDGAARVASSSPAPPEPTAAQVLAVLQRDGRLIDFLMEDVKPYSDAQIGAAVRNVHAGCRDALRRYLTLEPVLDSEEGARITIDAGTNAARVKVLGNVVGQPPYHGVVRHRGWILDGSELPLLPPAAPSVIAPAEIEVA
jgi:hypothetical protein